MASLPPNWELAYDVSGRMFHVNHQDHITSWEHPKPDAANATTDIEVPHVVAHPLTEAAGNRPADEVRYVNIIQPSSTQPTSVSIPLWIVVLGWTVWALAMEATFGDSWEAISDVSVLIGFARGYFYRSPIGMVVPVAQSIAIVSCTFAVLRVTRAFSLQRQSQDSHAGNGHGFFVVFASLQLIVVCIGLAMFGDAMMWKHFGATFWAAIAGFSLGFVEGIILFSLTTVSAVSQSVPPRGTLWLCFCVTLAAWGCRVAVMGIPLIFRSRIFHLGELLRHGFGTYSLALNIVAVSAHTIALLLIWIRCITSGVSDSSRSRKNKLVFAALFPYLVIGIFVLPLEFALHLGGDLFNDDYRKWGAVALVWKTVALILGILAWRAWVGVDPLTDARGMPRAQEYP